MTTHETLLDGFGGRRREMVVPYVISIAIHLIVIAGLVFFPAASPRRVAVPPVIQVRMVALPTATIKDLPRLQPATKTPTPAPQETPPAPRHAISLAPKPAPKPVHKPKPVPKEKKPVVHPKPTLKRKRFKPSRAVERAIKRIEHDLAKKGSNPVAEAIERIKRQEAEKQQRAPAADVNTPGTPSGTPSAKAAEEQELLDIYQVEIASIVQKHWAFAESLAGNATDLSASVAFTVMPNGEIRDIWFDKHSGNNYLDESARNAIIKSNPLPPHPQGLNRPFITIGLRFTPQGIR